MSVAVADREATVYVLDRRGGELLSADSAESISAVNRFNGKAVASSTLGDVFLLDPAVRTLFRVEGFAAGGPVAQAVWTGTDDFRIAVVPGSDAVPAGIYNVNVGSQTVTAMRLGAGLVLLPRLEFSDGTEVDLEVRGTTVSARFETIAGQLITMDGLVGVPSISPDGDLLAGFKRENVLAVGSRDGVVTIDLGVEFGGNPQLSWSVESQIAIVDRGRGAITIVNIISGEVSSVPEVTSAASAFWSPSGNYLAIQTDSGVSILDVDSKAFAQNVDDAIFFSWSPEADEALLTVGRCGAPRPLSLYIFDTSSLSLRQLVPAESGFQLHPDWTPDGETIAAANATGLFIIDVGTGSAERLLAPADGLVIPGQATAQWSEGGRWLFAWQSLGGRSLCP